MKCDSSRPARRYGVAAAITLVAALSVGSYMVARAQVQPVNNTGLGYYQRSVGGISINAEGLLDNAAPDMLGKLAELRAQALDKIPGGLNEAAPLRKISVLGLEAAIEQAVKHGKQLPDDVRFLAGLQEIRYVFVYPERQDIVLAGPGDGWKVDARGNIVGATNRRPIMLLDDLLVALRTARQITDMGFA